MLICTEKRTLACPMAWNVVRGAFWPIGNIAFLATQPLVEKNDGHVDKVTGKKVSAADAFGSKPVADTFLEHVSVQTSTWPKLVLAAVLWAYFVDLEGAKRGDWAWLFSIIKRDLAITWFCAGLQDFMGSSMFSPFSAKLQAYKYNPEPPKTRQLIWDCFWSNCSTIISSLFEAWALRGWVQGSLAIPQGCTPGDAWWTSPATLLLLLSMPYWRLTHFYFLHRSMHKWYPGMAPEDRPMLDIGEVLYNWVHSLHHYARNPTAWSGVAMHPVESSGYYTAMLLPHQVLAAAQALGMLAGASIHPIALLYTKMDLTIAALVGHDGIGYPGGGSQCHWLCVQRAFHPLRRPCATLPLPHPPIAHSSPPPPHTHLQPPLAHGCQLWGELRAL